MKTDNIHLNQLLHKLRELNPYLILLFGSYAYGKPNEDSDIDLLFVTKDEFMPQTFTEKNNLYISISEHIINIAKQVPIDLIVYTKPMYKQFIEIGSSFSKEILNNGIVLYEDKHEALA
jgi:predicted nucleotidyltransferase